MFRTRGHHVEYNSPDTEKHLISYLLIDLGCFPTQLYSFFFFFFLLVELFSQWNHEAFGYHVNVIPLISIKLQVVKAKLFSF